MAQRICSIDDCTKPVHGHGWCKTHWMRWRRHGDPLATKRIKGDDEARFWSKVDPTADPGGCWLWTGPLDGRGYGQIRIAGRLVQAHRFAYELMVGAIPGDLDVDHVWDLGCRHRHCVNAPAHLEPVTRSENTLRGFVAARDRRTNQRRAA